MLGILLFAVFCLLKVCLLKGYCLKFFAVDVSCEGCNFVSVHLFVIVCRDLQVNQEMRVHEVITGAMVMMDKMDLLDRR